MTAPATTLIIRHQPNTDPPAFHVTRLPDGKTTSQPATPPPPVGYPVEGRPNSDLMAELQWYLETFLDYPFHPETDHAERVRKALRQWGTEVFETLFSGRQAGRMFDAATQADYAQLLLQISSDDPRILAWPWEALHDPEVGALAHTCRIERKLNKVRDPAPLPESLPNDRVNILLVVARPYDRDVGYRSIARPLVELIESEKLPANVDVLRPPTFEQLQRHLARHPGHYHILHFDGHGSYTRTATANDGFTYSGEGQIIFEKTDGTDDPVSAEQLSTLLRDHAVPAVVLNACQSAMIDGSAEDPFASVATALLRAGIRGVVAMAYSLYVSGAQQFLPAFYRRLFESGNLAEAVRGGRRQMLTDRGRVCVRGKYDLDDWLLPVLYEQEPFDFSFAAAARQAPAARESRIPAEARDADNPYGFIGRDGPLLELERAMRRPPAGILIHGLGGVGKTTLARGFVEWLDATNGLGHGCFWFNFHLENILAADYVLNRIGEALFGTQFIAADLDTRLNALAQALKENKFVIVWDNFEAVKGIEGTAVQANLSEADRGTLARFLELLRGGATKVIVTSRSPEDWLGPTRRFLVTLPGLGGEERWDYCEVLLRDLGITIDRSDKDLVELMNLLDGHPLAMRVILPRLEKGRLTAGEAVTALRSNLEDLGLGEGQAEEHLGAILRFTEQSLPEELRPLLIPLAMHEGFVEARLLERMAGNVDGAPNRAQIDRLFAALSAAGLLRDVGRAICKMHPVLTAFLRSGPLEAVPAQTRDSWARAYVDIMGGLADALAPEELHEQRFPFHVHGVNFHYALAEAERLGMDEDFGALAQSLAMYALNSRNLTRAEKLSRQLGQHWRKRGGLEGEATAWHLLGRIAQECRDLVAAEESYRKALEITEKQGNERRAANIYYQLGRVAEERRDFVAAEEWYRRALAIEEKLGNEHGAALTYHQLGNLFLETRGFEDADNLYQKALRLFKKQEDERGVARANHQLGRVAEERRDFAVAEERYRRSLAISEKQGDERVAALTYHQLGFIAQERRDLVAAEEWYQKSLDIKEAQRDEYGAALTYHQLGMVAQQRRDFVAAEEWYRKSLAIDEKRGNEHGAASTYHQLGMVAQQRRDLVSAEEWYRRSLAIKEKLGDEYRSAITYHQLGTVAQERRDLVSAEEWYRKSLVIAEKQGNKHRAASTYIQLASLAHSQEYYEDAGQWFLRALLVYVKLHDTHRAQLVEGNFLINYRAAPPPEKAKLKAMWEEAGLGPLPEQADTATGAQ